MKGLGRALDQQAPGGPTRSGRCRTTSAAVPVHLYSGEVGPGLLRAQQVLSRAGDEIPDDRLSAHPPFERNELPLIGERLSIDCPGVQLPVGVSVGQQRTDEDVRDDRRAGGAVLGRQHHGLPRRLPGLQRENRGVVLGAADQLLVGGQREGPRDAIEPLRHENQPRRAGQRAHEGLGIVVHPISLGSEVLLQVEGVRVLEGETSHGPRCGT